MEFRNVKYIIGLVAFALCALIGVQLFWAYYSFRLSEKTFRSNAMEAMQKAIVIMDDNITCFELFSKTRINSKEGFYMLRRRCEEGKYVETQSPDTLPVYFEHANKNFPFRFTDLKFDYPVNLEMVLRFRYLPMDTLQGEKEFHNTKMQMGPTDFREKLSDKDPVAVRFDTLAMDSILRVKFAANSIHEPFRFGYIRQENNKLEYSTVGSVPTQLFRSPLRLQLTNDKYFSIPFDLVVYFPNYNSLVFAGIRTVLISSVLVIGILLFSFYLFIRIILRQRKLSEMKNDFINNMTHEFKTPLANISIALETISDKNFREPETNKKLFQIIGQETGRLSENVEKILQVARFEKEKIQLSFEQLDMHQVIQKAVSSFDALLSGNGVEIQFDLQAVHPEISGDETHLINVICNIVDNAIKYSREHVQILIRSESNDREFIFTVKDNGIGMDREVQKRIFERFFRESNGDRHDVKGFGLGLAYVKSIVEEHHGSIHVRSHPGKGSEFEVRLPFKQ